MNNSPISYNHHRLPPQIISHAMLLYFRFPLSLRLVEEMFLERGIVVSYEAIRRWGFKFGADYAGVFLNLCDDRSPCGSLTV